MSAEMVMDSVGNGGNGGVEIGTDSSEATVAEVAVEAVVEKVPEKAVELVPKRRIVGFIQFDVAFGGKVPTDEVLAKFEIVEDGKKARRIEDITKAVVFKLGKDEMDTCFLLCSEVTGEEFQKILEAGGQKAFRCGVKRALEIRAAVKDEVDFQQCRHDAIKGLVTHDFGDRNSVWVAMRTMVEWPIKNFGPVVGELEDRERRLEMCAENAIEFEKAYASALKSDAPRDRKTFSDWDYKFRSDWKKKAGRKVPFVMDLSLVTRRFGRFGTFGCFLLAGDVELFQELHGKKRNRDGKIIVKDGRELPVKYHRQDAYLGIVRWKYFHLEDEERDIAARKAEEDEKEGTMLENLGGFVDDSTLRYFHKNGNGDHAPRRIGKTNRDKRQSRRERRENGDE